MLAPFYQHFCALRNCGILSYHFMNKHLICRRSLYLFKNFISPLLATSNIKTVKFGSFKHQCIFTNSRKMTTARLAGKQIDDVLYPKLEPYKTGMLKVKYFHFIEIQMYQRYFYQKLKKFFMYLAIGYLHKTLCIC